MPNWTENDLYIMGNDADIKKCLLEIAGENGAIDFDKIVPSPKIFDKIDELAGVEPGILGKRGDKDFVVPEELMEELKAVIPKYDVLGKEVTTIFNSTAYNSWGHTWNQQNWGTKWNAHDINDSVPIEEHSEIYGGGNDGYTLFKKLIQFTTAWSPPEPIIKALGLKYPKLTFWLKYWEQGMGFKGEYAVANDKVEVDYSAEYNGMLDPTDACRGG